MATYASLMNGGIRYGKGLHASVTTIKPGMLIKMDTSGSNSSGSATVSLAGATGSVLGIAYGGRNLTYRPTSQTFGQGDLVVAVMGSGVMALSSDLFTGGSFPSWMPCTLYSGASGLWSSGVGANKVGQALEVVQTPNAVGGIGVNQPVCIVNFNIVP